MNEQKKNPLSVKTLTALVLCIALAVTCLMTGCKKTETANETADQFADVAPTTQTVAGAYGENTPTVLDSYAVTEAAPYDVNMSTVIAVNENNEVCLTNGEMQIYFWIEFYNFMNSYGSYAAMMGLNETTPLSQQQSMQEGSTWEQYFLESAALHYNENYALAQAAVAEGYVISAEDEQNIADIADPNGKFAADAKEAGFETAEAYLQANFGKGVSIEDYQNYLKVYYAAYDYYSGQRDAIELAITEDDVIAHYDENAEQFSSFPKVNNISVRHILIGVEGEQDENGDYPEEAWLAAEQKANEVYQQWQTNPTEDYFIELAGTHSTDPGSAENGGIYEDVYPGQMLETFNDWCFDPSRATGDHDIVQSDFGYHIMFFVGQCESRKWFDEARNDIIAIKLNEMLDEKVTLFPVKFDYSKVRIYDIIATLPVTE